ncbi:hypothetical protein MZD04_gp322 [Pseudomonas phage Psa21]|uniref:Uncharacterized protein n=1 Tax=Pseudomonas phage Psa21 TaxID=2530023 RepID=A0A481W559_9CAUD|nr:hypothetical protein MZD04_gp322 [Pseudomonas phage Psa21]QBJ02848.1 hypothetical protein PSA21_322 [Pseudomonas phage Psa21]
MRTQVEIWEDERRSLEIALIRATLQQLWNQDYEPGLLTMNGVVHLVEHKVDTSMGRNQTTGHKEFTLDVLESTKFKLDAPLWTIVFDVEDNKVSELVIDTILCKRKTIIHELGEYVLHILSTYHPDGRKLFEN